MKNNETKKMLKKINLSMGISQLSDEKTEKYNKTITNIEHLKKQRLYDSLFLEDDFQDVTETEYNNAIDLIVNEKLYERFTISIVRKIASKEKHFCNTSCLEIINSGFTDTILDDLKQEIFIKMLEMCNNNMITLGNDKKSLVFGNYYNKKDEKKSSYLLLYRTIENYFYKEKKHNDNSAICLDSYNDDVTSTNNESDYIFYLHQTLQEKTLEKTITRTEILSVFRTIKTKYPKHYTNICNVFELRYNGLTYDEIGKKLNLTKNQVRYDMQILRNVFDDLCLKINIDNTQDDTTKNAKNAKYFVDNNGSTTYYINRQKDYTKKDIKNYFERIKKEKENKRVYNTISTPLSCGFCTTIDNEKEMEAIRENDYTYTFMFYAKNNSVVTVDDRNMIIHEYSCYNKATVKKLSCELPHYHN